MTYNRHIVRRAESPAIPLTEDRLWPVYSALAMCGAFLAGVAVSVGSFRDPNPLRNPITWLLLLGGVLAWTVWLIQRIPARRVSRASWLASILSFGLHGVLVVWLAFVHIFQRAEPPEQENSRRQPRKVFEVSEYALPPVRPDREQENVYDRPAPAELAESREAAETTRQMASSSIAMPIPDTPVEPDPRQTITPTRRVATADPLVVVAPPAALRRRERRHSAPPAFQVEAEADATTESPRNTESTEKLALAREATLEPNRQTADLDRRWTRDAQARNRDAPEIARRDTSESELSRQPPELAELSRRLQDPTPPTPHQVRSESVEHATNPVNRVEPEFGSLLARSAPRRSPVEPTISTEIPQTELRTGPRDSAEIVHRANDPTRITTLDPTQPLADLPRQALRVAERPVGPRELAVPLVTSVSETAESVAPEPAPTALAKGTEGTAGFGRDDGLAEAELGSLARAETPANSRPRRRTRSAPEAMALSASEPTQRPRMMAGASRPRTSVVAESIEQGAIAAGTEVTEEFADAALTTERTADDAPADIVAATSGAADSDTGPPRMTRSSRLARAAGGGQPSIHAAPPIMREIARTSNARPQTSLLAEDLAESPAAPLAQGGGAPEEDLPDPTASRMERSLAGSALPALRSPSGESPDNDLQVPRATRMGPPERASDSRGAVARETVDGGRGPARQAGPTGRPAVTPVEVASVAATLPRDGPSTGSTAGPMIPEAQRSSLAPPAPIDLAVETGDGGLDPTAEEFPGLAHSNSLERAGFVVGPEIPRRQSITAIVARSIRSARPISSTSDSVAADAFLLRRSRRESGRGLGLPPPLPKTEEAIERGLFFLRKYQGADGRWSLHTFAEGEPNFSAEVPTLRSDTAATGLALLAFLGAGYHHQDDDYREQVAKGLDFLTRNQQANGDLFIPEDENSNRSVALYSHGIAALALTEAFGMTQDAALREPAQRALDFIASAQHSRWGGWRYAPGVSSDTSVSGWMVMALKSGQLAGLRVSRRTYAGVDQWLDAAQASDQEPHLFRYNPYAPDTVNQLHGRKPTPTITSVGLLMRMYRGLERDHPTIVDGTAHLLEHLPAVGSRTTPLRDTYYWYYATQVMFHAGGASWETWNRRLHPLLVDDQVAEGPFAGSWHPLRPVPDRWGVHGGRMYVTTMNLLSLEITYRHLPIYGN